MPNNTPFIFFDAIETWAVSPGIGHLDVAATFAQPGLTPGKATQVSVAHLRFPLAMLPSLKQAIEQIESAAMPVVGKSVIETTRRDCL
jgi:hypothetical protein